MVKGLKGFINEAKDTILKENRKINGLYREIDNYETLIYVVGQVGAVHQVKYYREKINECYSKIEKALENVNNSRNRIETIKIIDKIIKRGERCA